MVVLLLLLLPLLLLCVVVCSCCGLCIYHKTERREQEGETAPMM